MSEWGGVGGGRHGMPMGQGLGGVVGRHGIPAVALVMKKHKHTYIYIYVCVHTDRANRSWIGGWEREGDSGHFVGSKTPIK